MLNIVSVTLVKKKKKSNKSLFRYIACAQLMCVFYFLLKFTNQPKTLVLKYRKKYSARYFSSTHYPCCAARAD